MLDEKALTLVYKDEEERKNIDRGKRNKTLNEAKPDENINKNPQSFV